MVGFISALKPQLKRESLTFDVAVLYASVSAVNAAFRAFPVELSPFSLILFSLEKEYVSVTVLRTDVMNSQLLYILISFYRREAGSPVLGRIHGEQFNPWRR